MCTQEVLYCQRFKAKGALESESRIAMLLSDQRDPRGHVCVLSVPGAVVMFSQGVRETPSGVDPTDGVNGCDGGTALDKRYAPLCRGTGTSSGMGQRST